jgi:predicted  nucleic acid-binding Zn-ribbon protein
MHARLSPLEPEGLAHASARARTGNASSQRAATLVVDDTLLACCNHAYDIAQANGSREVMLEHLIHAMTRVPDAAQALEHRGVHVMALRRDSAAVIANDLPISTTPVTSLRASSDMDAVLHLAAANARLRSDRPTSVRDVLFVLMNYEREAGAVELLRRHWPSWQRELAAERMEDAPPAGVVRASTTPQAHERAFERETRATRTDAYESGSVAQLIERRLDGLERSLGALGQDVGRDRRALSDVVNGLQDSVSAQRSDSHNFRNLLGDRLQRLEKAVENARFEGPSGAQIESVIGSRLARLEKMQESLLAQRSGAPALASLEAAIGERLQRLEKAFEASRADLAKPPAGITDRLGAMERAVENKLAEISRIWGALGDRLQRIERALEGVTSQMPAGLLDRMQTMEKGFEARIEEGLRVWSGLGDRLSGLERAVTAQRAEIAHVQSTISSEVKAIEKAMVQEVGGSATLAERLGMLEAALGTIREDTGRLTKAQEGEIGELRNVLTRLNGTMQSVSGAIEQWRTDHGGELGTISNRLEALEHSSVRPLEMLESLSARVQAISLEQQRSQHIKMTAAGRRRGFWRWLFGLR